MAIASVPLNNPVLYLMADAIKRSRDRLVLSGGYLEMTGIQQLHFVLVRQPPDQRCTCNPNGGGKQVDFANPDFKASIPAFLAEFYRFPLPKTS